MDALPQVVHVIEVLAPPVVDHLEQDRPLQITHQLVTEFLLALVVGLLGVGGQFFGQRSGIDHVGVEARHVDRYRPDQPQLGVEPGQVPLLDQIAGRVLLDQPADHAVELLPGDVGHVTPLEDLAAVAIDDPALLVHHVVVLEHPLADQEVLLLDLLLGVLDRLGQHLRLERDLAPVVIGRAEPIDDVVDPVTGEKANHVVLRREEEA